MRDKVKYNNYMRVKILERYREKRAAYIDKLGGKCVLCGATTNLEFDHIECNKKSFAVSVDWSISKEILEKEIDKCQLLCSKCHMEKSIREKGKQPIKGKDVHGTISSYRYCKCSLCKAAKNSYMRAYKKKKQDAPVAQLVEQKTFNGSFVGEPTSKT